MPHEVYVDPVTNDGPRFHSNVPVSELTERDTRAIEASVVSSAPPVAEIEDGVTHDIWPTPTDPHGARGLEPPDPKSGDRGWKASPLRARGRLMLNRAKGENTDEPQWPLPDPFRSRQGHLDFLIRSVPT